MDGMYWRCCLSGEKGPSPWLTLEKPLPSLCIHHVSRHSAHELHVRIESQRQMFRFQRNAKRYAKDFRPLVAFLFSKDDRTATALPSVHSPETLGTISMHRRQIEVPDDPHVPSTLLHSSVSQKSGAFNSRWKFSNSPYVYSHGGWHATIRSHDERYHSTTLLFLLAFSLCCSSQLSIPIHSYIYLIIY